MSKSVSKNVVSKMALNILNVVLPLITGPYLARVLNVDLYGQYNQAFAVLSWFIPIASFGIYNYGIRVISQAKNDKNKLEKLFTSLFCMGTISSVLVMVVYSAFILFRMESDKAIYQILAIQIIACVFLVEWMNEAFEQYGFILYKTLIVRICNVLAILIFVKKPEDIVPYALVVSFAQLLNNLLSFLYVKRRVSFCRIKITDLTALIKPLFIMLLLTNASLFYTSLDRLFLTVFAKDTPVYSSYYTFSQVICQLITNVINAIVLATIPRLARYLGEKKDKEYKDLLLSSSRTFFMLGIPLCIGLSVMAKPIMFIYGGAEYIAAGTTMCIFAFRCLLWLCDVTLANQIIFIHGKESLLTRIYFIGGGINLLLNSLLALLGLVRPELLIFTTMLSEIVLVTLQLRCIRNNIDPSLRVLNKQIIKYFVTALMFYPLSAFVLKLSHFEYVMNFNFIKSLALAIGACVVVYGAMLFITKDTVLIKTIERIKSKARSK